MNLAPQIERIVSFIRNKSEELPLGQFTYEQLVCFVAEKIAKNQLLVVFEGGAEDEFETVIGAVVIDPNRNGKFWIEQIWADNKYGMTCLVRMLEQFFPTTKVVYGLRSGSREVAFNLETLQKIYGR